MAAIVIEFLHPLMWATLICLHIATAAIKLIVSPEPVRISDLSAFGLRLTDTDTLCRSPSHVGQYQ